MTENAAIMSRGIPGPSKYKVSRKLTELKVPSLTSFRMFQGRERSVNGRPIDSNTSKIGPATYKPEDTTYRLSNIKRVTSVTFDGIS